MGDSDDDRLRRAYAEFARMLADRLGVPFEIFQAELMGLSWVDHSPWVDPQHFRDELDEVVGAARQFLGTARQELELYSAVYPSVTAPLDKSDMATLDRWHRALDAAELLLARHIEKVAECPAVVLSAYDHVRFEQNGVLLELELREKIDLTTGGLGGLSRAAIERVRDAGSGIAHAATLLAIPGVRWTVRLRSVHSIDILEGVSRLQVYWAVIPA